MPVRIYDISKKLGLENKEVLSKAKELGIAAARVASSSLDKITAEYLEQQLIQAYPDRVAAVGAPAALAPTPTAEAEKITVITAPPPEVEAVRESESETATAVMEPPEPPMAEAPASPTAIAPEPPLAPAPQTP